MCNTDDTHARQALSQMSRHTTISSRNSTDLGAEYDRSRRRAGSERQEGSK